MTNRAMELIDRLYLTDNSFEQGCLDCGFEKEDLTEEEINAVLSFIYQCEACGYWHERFGTSRFNNSVYGSICNECPEF